MVDGEKEAKGIELNERQDRRTILRGGVFRYMDHEYASPELVGREGQFITLVTIDYGTMNPFSAGLWRVGNGRAVRVNEVYYNGRELKKQKTDEEYCDMVAALAGARAISAVIVDPSAASFIAALRRRSGFKVRQANNDVANGIRCVADYLLDGKIKIHRRCAATIREFGLYRWDEKQDND